MASFPPRPALISPLSSRLDCGILSAMSLLDQMTQLGRQARAAASALEREIEELV